VTHGTDKVIPVFLITHCTTKTCGGVAIENHKLISAVDGCRWLILLPGRYVPGEKAIVHIDFEAGEHTVTNWAGNV
jgi:hypothetical protein